MNREHELYLELGRVWSNENGESFRRAVTLLADRPDMPVPDVVQTVLRAKVKEDKRSAMAVEGGGFMMNAGFSSRISANPLQNSAGLNCSVKNGAATSDDIRPAFGE
jgi:hypothetical protein